MKKTFLTLLLLVSGFSLSGEILASTSRSVTETQIENGSGQVYQYVETTVNGQTVREESTQPGRLELEMKKIGKNGPTVAFSQETVSSPSPKKQNKEVISYNLFEKIKSFFNQLLTFLSHIFGA